MTSKPKQPDPDDTADYLGALARSAAALARGAGLKLLAFLLEMAAAQAEEDARRPQAGKD